MTVVLAMTKRRSLVTTPLDTGTLQVDPVSVINILKARLSEEISKQAVLEAALLGARDRETELTKQLDSLRNTAPASEPSPPAKTVKLKLEPDSN
jgi:hypothetical protein